MLMYHGTCALKLNDILERGLVPRGKGEGNWDYSGCGSRRNAVYLTRSYALHFAEQCSDGHDLLVIEVDTTKIPEFFLGPDEDFLEQATRDNPEFGDIGNDLVARTQYFATCEWHHYSNWWEQSIAGLGSCCVKDHVPSTAITRYALVPKGHALIRMSDPTITLMNYALCGAYYRNLMRYVFGNLDFESDGIALDSSLLLRIPRDGIAVYWAPEKFHEKSY